jgi:hypothetical protein
VQVTGAYAFTSLNEARTSDDTVVLDYKDGRNVCTECKGPVNSVRYQWQGDHVAMLDPPPPAYLRRWVAVDVRSAPSDTRPRCRYGEYRLQTDDEAAGTYPSPPGSSTFPPA